MRPSKALPASVLAAAMLGACVPAAIDGGDAPSSAASSSAVSSLAGSSRAPGRNDTAIPLEVPEGFSVETVAEDIKGARVLVRDGFGNYWVSQPSEGTITQIEMENGKAVRRNAVFRNLRRPHGLAIDPQSNGFMLYVAEEHRVSRVPLYSDGPMEKIADLPGVGRHFTRTLGFGPDGRLYVSIGSTCDVCVEADERHGAILSMEKDGSDSRVAARGLRNAVFFRWHPGTGEMLATEMGRDMLGDDLPPEEVNVIREGAHYGWPFCYGDRVRDETFRPGDDFDCASTEPPLAVLPAHVAPLGIEIAPASWPSGYGGDLLVSAHGSWNSTVKVGYAVFRIPAGADGKPSGPLEKFLTGWLRPDGSVAGRPVDLLVDGDSVLVTDDRAGAIYRISPL